MAITTAASYLVLNYNSSPISVSTKHESYLIEGGTIDSPTSLPLTFDEIALINSQSPVFRIGLLRFDPQHEAELYEKLSILDWQDILTNQEIEEMILHPTMESTQRILDIENPAYFDRIRGALVGLKNAGADVSSKMDKVIEQRRVELDRRQRKTQIRLVPQQEAATGPSQADFDAMRQQLEVMQAMIAQLTQAKTDSATTTATKPVPSVASAATDRDAEMPTKKSPKRAVSKATTAD